MKVFIVIALTFDRHGFLRTKRANRSCTVQEVESVLEDAKEFSEKEHFTISKPST